MTPADKRVLELLDRWLTSIELHLKYVDLDEQSYEQVQSWPTHERPARWILELAQQKVLQLKTLCKTQIAKQDSTLAESLELMAFLANLVGAQNINRFIPLADPAGEKSISPAATTDPTADDATQESIVPVLNNPQYQVDATREIPQLPAQQYVTSAVEHTREMPKLTIPVKKPAEKSTEKSVTTDRIQELIIADAIRLLKWGKQWHELAESIARMAERPAITEVRRILRSNKPQIEAKIAD
ncbi:MAG: hypothetical protein AB7F79_08245 [Steroidobacteraceae bacterium]